MEIHHLKTFVTVAREGSITRASELLHLSQPAVSAHIKAIEDVAGQPLFERTPRGMRLTASGQRLVVKAEQTLAAHRSLLNETELLKGRVSGTLRFGAGSSTSDATVARFLARFSLRCPEVQVELTHGTSLETLGGLRNGSLDAGPYHEAGEACL